MLLVAGLICWVVAGLCAFTYTKMKSDWRDAFYALYISFLAIGAPAVGFGLSHLTGG